MGHAMNRCCNILTSFRTPIVCAAWASFFIFWLHRGWVAFDLSFVAARLSSLVIFAIGACGVALGWWLRGRWMKTLTFGGVYTDSWTKRAKGIDISSYCITWNDGQEEKQVAGSLNTEGQLEVSFNPKQALKRGTLRTDGSIRWSNGAVWLRL